MGLRDERGATATEYVFLLGLIALVILGSVALYGGYLSDEFEANANTVESAVN